MPQEGDGFRRLQLSSLTPAFSCLLITISLSSPRAALGLSPGTPGAAEVVMEVQDLPDVFHDTRGVETQGLSSSSAVVQCLQGRGCQQPAH